MAGHACSFERCILGVTHRRSLARSPVSLSALSNLSSTIPILAAQRVADAIAAKTCRGLTRPRKARSQRILHRRQLQRREKRGSGVGPTKRGKGSKIMAIADGHGLPFAVHVASASPHETKLVETTLEQRFLRETPERMIGDRAYDNHGVTFRKQAEWWLNHAQTRKRKPIKPATALGFTSYLNKWLYPNLGDLPLSSVNNLVV